ncbi:DsbA family oxidoreductase, partial [Stenotrophomonas maltophilia]|nr:DsbA family oxidoreductase [Stenotrophomonas maltophilia]
MRIDIYSDVVCPWCWIGKHRFQQGVQLLGPNAPDLDIHWQPFQLDPDADATPVPLREAYARKFGGVERTEQILGQTQTTARAEGLPMDFNQGQVRVTTLPAHRVLWLAGEHGVQDAVGEALFRVHFEHGQNLADPSVLIKAGVAGGLDGGEIAQMLASDRGLAEVDAKLAQ